MHKLAALALTAALGVAGMGYAKSADAGFARFGYGFRGYGYGYHYGYARGRGWR